MLSIWESSGGNEAVGLQSDAIRALAARQQSACFVMRVSVTNDPEAGGSDSRGGRVFIALEAGPGSDGTRELLWSGSCSRARYVRELPDLLGALAHITGAGAAHGTADGVNDLPGLSAQR